MTAVADDFSWYFVAVLLVVLAASCGVFWALVRRWTTQRQWASLSEWAANHGYRLVHPNWPVAAPEPVDRWAEPPPRVRWLLTSVRTDIVQMETGVGPGPMPLHRQDAPGPTPSNAQAATSPDPGIVETPGPSRWHLLIRRVATAWPPTGLRPRMNPASVLDLLPLTSFPALAPPERFVVFGIDSTAARRVARSHLLSLLPRDVGCVLHGSFLILDFSSRPFDTIEMLRMVSLADQLEQNLPG